MLKTIQYDCNVISTFKKLMQAKITNENKSTALPQSCHQRLLYPAVLRCSHIATGYHLAVPLARDWSHLLKVPRPTSQVQPIINQYPHQVPNIAFMQCNYNHMIRQDVQVLNMHRQQGALCGSSSPYSAFNWQTLNLIMLAIIHYRNFCFTVCYVRNHNNELYYAKNVCCTSVKLSQFLTDICICIYEGRSKSSQTDTVYYKIHT